MPELTKIQKKTLKLFANSKLKDKFYWTGGTLLSFRFLRHRSSEDIDFFTNQKFTFKEVNEFAESLKKPLELNEVESNKIYDRWEFLLKNQEKLKVEFALYDHPRIKPLKKWSGIYIDSFEDLATNKTMALFGRNDPKDLIDMYFILSRNKFKIKTLLKWAEKKFGLTVSESAFWSEALKTLKEINEIRPLLLGNKKTQEKTIQKAKEYLEKQSVNFVYGILK